LTLGPYARQYEAATLYIIGWLENRIINIVKGNQKSISLRLIDLTADDSSVDDSSVASSEKSSDNEEDDSDSSSDEEEVNKTCLAVSVLVLKYLYMS
jgi:hypothetical protein